MKPNGLWIAAGAAGFVLFQWYQNSEESLEDLQRQLVKAKQEQATANVQVRSDLDQYAVANAQRIAALEAKINQLSGELTLRGVRVGAPITKTNLQVEDYLRLAFPKPQVLGTPAVISTKPQLYTTARY